VSSDLPTAGEAPPAAPWPERPGLDNAVRRGRGRRPAQQVRAEIIDAAGRLLLAEGLASFTVERVAALAGVSKMTIYKWWPSKGVLALEGYATHIDRELAMPDSGDIEADLTTHLLRFVHVLRDTPGGRVTAELLGAAQTDAELAEAFRSFYLEPRRAVGIAALEAARARGQLRPDADPEVLSDQLWGACMYRLLTGHRPLTDEYARALVRDMMHGIGN
jgi:AcrR family transcriptional regulator